jgi:hypothetical protein
MNLIPWVTPKPEQCNSTAATDAALAKVKPRRLVTQTVFLQSDLLWLLHWTQPRPEAGGAGGKDFPKNFVYGRFFG